MRAAKAVLSLIIIGAACHEGSAPTDPSSSGDRLGARGTSPSLLLAAGSTTGVPYGPAQLWRPNGTWKWGPAPFTASLGMIQASTIVQLINSARAMNQKVMLNMTGGSHERYKTDGKFDFAKWKAAMDTYDKESIKLAVQQGVEDGTIVMNSVMDEPQVVDWGGVMTKPLLDTMASYVKNLFPTLPTGVVARWDWRPEEQYKVIDFIMAQYMWQKGDVTAYRDNVLAQARKEGIAVVFSLNILDGGIKNWQTRDCPSPLTGGFGTQAPNCRMTADQVREWGQLLGVAGCAMSMWQFDSTFMGKADNQQAFVDVAAALAAVPDRPPCTRPSEAPPPPPPPPPENQGPDAAFDPPSCILNVPCRFRDGSRDSDGTIVSWSWSFADESGSSDQDPSHTYAAPGSYDVTLQVSDDDGAEARASGTVVVRESNAPPSAGFDPPGCQATLPCDFADHSTDDDGTVVNWSWDFGDGGTSSDRNPSHTFAAPGRFMVTLGVTDNDEGTGQTEQEILVADAPPPPNHAPTAAFDPPVCRATVACAFLDGSTDEDGSIAGWSWDFGDGGTSADQNPSHTFGAEGEFRVTLAVTDDDGDAGQVIRTIQVAQAPPPPNRSPTAAFDPPSCTAGVPCLFSDKSTDPDGQIATRSWDFGTGSGSAAKDPSFIYPAAGSYNVTLRVTDDAGAADAITRAVAVSAPPPVAPAANFSFSCTNLSCAFTDKSTDPDHQISARRWTFGDGTSSAQVSPSHTYSAAKSYVVSLVLTYGSRQAQRSQTVTVTAPKTGITLTVTGRTTTTAQVMTLRWSGAVGPNVSVYRNGKLWVLKTLNDGLWVNTHALPGAASYTYKVCAVGTTTCSNLATVRFR
jgi:PKD repeat protein